jgi:hypothetical protein
MLNESSKACVRLVPRSGDPPASGSNIPGQSRSELSPLLARRGGRDIKRNIAKLPLMERTGWWFKIKRKNVFEAEPPPRLRRFGCFAIFSYRRSHPSWPGGAMAPVRQVSNGRRLWLVLEPREISVWLSN